MYNLKCYLISLDFFDTFHELYPSMNLIIGIKLFCLYICNILCLKVIEIPY